jgi:TM2 domain-containing membrane protein YozV
MAVDIVQLTEQLTPAQQRDVRRAYKARAKSETAAFLWCFFLGVLGAHRFYLRQWARAMLHVQLLIVVALVIVAGIVAGWPLVLIAAIAVPVALGAFIWAFVELFHIDDEVSERNLHLAERLIAAALLADPQRERRAQALLDDAERAADAAAAAPPAAPVSSGSEIAAPQTEAVAPAPEAYSVAVQPLTGVAAFGAVEVYQVVAEPAPASDAPAASASADGADLSPVPGAIPAWDASTQPAEASSPTAAWDADLLAPLAAGAAAEEIFTVRDTQPATPANGVDAPFDAEDAEDAEATWPDLPPVVDEPLAPADSGARDATSSIDSNQAFAAPDVTDLGGPLGDVPPVSDIDPAGSWLLAAPDEGLLVLIPEPAPELEPLPEPEALPAPTAELTPEPLRAAPPLWPVTPEWPTPEDASGAAPVTTGSDTGTITNDMIAAAAGLSAGAGAMAFFDQAERAEPSASAPETPTSPEPMAESEPPMPTMPLEAQAAAPPAAAPHLLKHIKVVRQVKVGDEVVDESFAEAYIDPSEDPEPVRERLREQLRREAEARHASEQPQPND